VARYPLGYVAYVYPWNRGGHQPAGLTIELALNLGGHKGKGVADIPMTVALRVSYSYSSREGRGRLAVNLTSRTLQPVFKHVNMNSCDLRHIHSFPHGPPMN
jgi:hypothetical protein